MEGFVLLLPLYLYARQKDCESNLTGMTRQAGLCQRMSSYQAASLPHVLAPFLAMPPLNHQDRVPHWSSAFLQEG